MSYNPFQTVLDESHLKPGTKLKKGDEELKVVKPVGDDKYLVKEKELEEATHVIHTKTANGEAGPKVKVNAIDDANAEFHAKKLIGQKPYRGHTVDRVVKLAKESVDESVVKREVKGRQYVSAEVAIRLAREIAAKRKPGEKATHSDLQDAQKRLTREDVEYINENRKPEKDDHEPHPVHGHLGLTKGEVRDTAYEEGHRHGVAGKHGSESKTWGAEGKHYSAGFMHGRNTSDKLHKKMSRITRTNEAAELEEEKLSTWKVSYDYGPHQSNEITVKAKDEKHAHEVGKAKAKKIGHNYPMINHATPVKESVELDEAHRPGSVMVLVNHSTSEQGLKGNKYTVAFHPDAKSPRGRTKHVEISHHATQEEATAAKIAYAKKHAEHGVHALKGLGEEVELDATTTNEGLVGAEYLKHQERAKEEWVKNNPLMKGKTPVQQQAAWAIYSTFHDVHNSNKPKYPTGGFTRSQKNEEVELDEVSKETQLNYASVAGDHAVRLAKAIKVRKEQGKGGSQEVKDMEDERDKRVRGLARLAKRN